jgi:hypothetical protein
MGERRWKATWHEGGSSREYIFTAPDNRALARIDLQLKLIEQGRPVPHAFELEEGQPVISVTPSINTVRR